MTKLGMRRTIKTPPKPKPPSLKPVSARQAKRLIEMTELKQQLIRGCYNQSELSCEKPDWQSGYLVEPHHICGRVGKHLLNVFEIIMLTRTEHDYEEKHKSFERKRELLALVKPLRIAQGFIEENYG